MSPLRGLALALATLLATAQVGAHEGEPPQPAPSLRFEPPAPGSYELPVIQRISTHTLLDQEGRRAALPGLSAGELAVVAFVYLSCGEACPSALAVLQRVDREAASDPVLQDRVRLYAVSFDPARDTPAQMGRLSAQLSPRGRWAFLTAPDLEALAPVLDDFGQTVLAMRGPDGEPSGLIQHVLKVFLVDSEGAVRNVYSTGFLDARLVLNDARTLIGTGAP